MPWPGLMLRMTTFCPAQVPARTASGGAAAAAVAGPLWKDLRQSSVISSEVAGNRAGQSPQGAAAGASAQGKVVAGFSGAAPPVNLQTGAASAPPPSDGAGTPPGASSPEQAASPSSNA